MSTFFTFPFNSQGCQGFYLVSNISEAEIISRKAEIWSLISSQGAVFTTYLGAISAVQVLKMSQLIFSLYKLTKSPALICTQRVLKKSNHAVFSFWRKCTKEWRMFNICAKCMNFREWRLCVSVCVVLLGICTAAYHYRLWIPRDSLKSLILCSFIVTESPTEGCISLDGDSWE